MKIVFPSVSQNDFEYAIKCLESCKQESAEKYGFNYPYFTPGGMYGEQWWQLDSSLALSGYKWVDRAFCERALLNFVESQKEDGRICLWGADLLPKKVAGGNVLEQTTGVSSLPKLFDVAYHILKGCEDRALKIKVYATLKKYLDWWFDNRQDKKTGLITAVFEETFIPYLGSSNEYAPVDTNVEVYVGCTYVELLAVELGNFSDAEKVRSKKAKLKDAINEFLWSEEKGAYYPYYVKEGKLGDVLMASTFYPLRMQIAPKERREKLIGLLTNNDYFNWNTIPLTSVSKKDDNFVTTKGDYVGNDSWSGNVWTLVNEMVIRGLVDCQKNELASRLVYKTLLAFNGNLAEFINPFDGTGHGVLKYAWTASQYLELIIETIFGVDYSAKDKVVTISPNLTKKLKNDCLYIKGLNVTNNVLIDIMIDRGVVKYTVSNDSVKIKIENCK